MLNLKESWTTRETKSLRVFEQTRCQMSFRLRTIFASQTEEKPVTELMITYRGTVYPWQCDHMGHMNVMWYTNKFDEASWQLLSKLGLTRSRCRKEGTGMAAVEQHIQYKRELRAGDLVTIRSAVLEIRN